MENIKNENKTEKVLERKQDTRILRSKIAIKQAFFSALEEKGYENITIKEISERGLVNRKTFYAHYETKDILHKEVIEDAISLLGLERVAKKAFNIQNRTELERYITEVFTNIFAIVKENRGRFIALLDDPTSSAFQERLEQVLYKEIMLKTLEGRKTRAAELPLALTHNIIVTIALNTMRWWIHQDEVSMEDGVAMMVFIFENDLLSVLGFDDLA